jgi:hypothetical protein
MNVSQAVAVSAREMEARTVRLRAIADGMRGWPPAPGRVPLDEAACPHAANVAEIAACRERLVRLMDWLR